MFSCDNLALSLLIAEEFFLTYSFKYLSMIWNDFTVIMLLLGKTFQFMLIFSICFVNDMWIITINILRSAKEQWMEQHNSMI